MYVNGLFRICIGYIYWSAFPYDSAMCVFTFSYVRFYASNLTTRAEHQMKRAFDDEKKNVFFRERNGRKSFKWSYHRFTFEYSTFYGIQSELRMEIPGIESLFSRRWTMNNDKIKLVNRKRNEMAKERKQQLLSICIILCTTTRSTIISTVHFDRWKKIISKTAEND